MKDNIKYLNLIAKHAPKANRAKIKELANALQTKKLTKYKDVEKVAVMLSTKSPAAERAYDKLMGIAAPEPVAAPGGAAVVAPAGGAKQPRGKQWQITIMLYTDHDRAKKEDKDKGEAEHDDDLPPEAETKYKKYLSKNYKGHHQFWKGQITVSGGTDEYWSKLQHRFIRQSNNKKEFNPLFKKCLTSQWFKERVQNSPGYIVAFYIIDYQDTNKGEAEDPKKMKKKTGEKMTIAYRYCSNTLDLSADTFQEAMKLNNYVKNECWFNSIWDFYGDTLLREGKQQNKLRREVILKLLNQTEESIKKGLTIEEVLPFFVHCKLRLRVFNKFYKMTFKYDPPVENRTNKAMYCLDDGDHIYTLNHELDRLAHKSWEEVDDKEMQKLICKTDYKLDKEGEDRKRKYRMIKHIDDILRNKRALLSVKMLPVRCLNSKRI